MKNNLRRLLGAAAALGLALAPGWAQALSCMVVGEKTARVQTSDGEKSPTFLSTSCETLRALSGKAMVSWISRDGKPNFSPIGATGVSQLPAVGTEERSATVVWTEMTSNRESRRPAFMRALDEQRPARIYIPKEGLVFPASSDSALSVKLVDAQSEKPEKLISQHPGNDGSIRLTREGLTPGSVFAVELTGSGNPEKWLLKLVDDTESSRIESRIAEIVAADIDDSQRQILKAMLYEQLKLPVNMALTVQARP